MFALVRKSIAFIDSGFHIVVSPYPKGEDPARGLLVSAGDTPGMAADPRGEGYRRCREEGQENGPFNQWKETAGISGGGARFEEIA